MGTEIRTDRDQEQLEGGVRKRCRDKEHGFHTTEHQMTEASRRENRRRGEYVDK